MPASEIDVRLAVDIGGTFTDVVLETGSRLFTIKVLTTPDAPELGVVTGIGNILERSGVLPDGVTLLIHGTTLATNAILERKGACTALITTEGFRDVLEIGYESRYDQYDIMIEKPEPLVPRTRRLTVAERVDVHGRELEPLDEAGVRALIPKLRRLEVESVAVGFLHAYANGEHERRVRDILADALPALSISLSSEVCPEVREYERFTTTAVNAYIRPMMEGYLGRLRQTFAAIGLECPTLLMTSAGGLTTFETAMSVPTRLLESGPAGGAILASQIAAELSLDKVISLDMGGTTAKLCLIEDGTPDTARDFEIGRAARFTKGSGLPLRLPVIEMLEIGAGGGSIARIDAMGKICVGPESAGAKPGPAAYALGGLDPTVTDADILLGRIEPAQFAGGQVPLEPALAERAIADAIGEPLGLDASLAAYSVCEMVDETMANAARVHAVERGKVASAHSLIAFGGSAPLHIGRLAEKLGIRRIIVPRDAGVGSAVGFLRAPVAYEVVRSRYLRLGDFDATLVNGILADMGAEAVAVVEAAAPKAQFVERRGAYMRYCGQGHEVFVSLPLRPLCAEDDAILRTAFERTYKRLFGRVIGDAEVEILTWLLTLSTKRAAPKAPADPPSRPAPESTSVRTIIDPDRGELVTVPVYWREDLAPGATFVGPGLIVEDQTTTYIPSRFAARISGAGHIVIEQEGELHDE